MYTVKSGEKYINNLKLTKAKEFLTNSSMDVTEILEALGFYPVHYFSKCFKEKEYITPLEFRKKVGNNIYMQLDDKFDNNTQL